MSYQILINNKSHTIGCDLLLCNSYKYNMVQGVLINDLANIVAKYIGCEACDCVENNLINNFINTDIQILSSSVQKYNLQINKTNYKSNYKYLKYTFTIFDKIRSSWLSHDNYSYNDDNYIDDDGDGDNSDNIVLPPLLDNIISLELPINIVAFMIAHYYPPLNLITDNVLLDHVDYRSDYEYPNQNTISNYDKYDIHKNIHTNAMHVGAISLLYENIVRLAIPMKSEPFHIFNFNN